MPKDKKLDKAATPPSDGEVEGMVARTSEFPDGTNYTQAVKLTPEFHQKLGRIAAAVTRRAKRAGKFAGRSIPMGYFIELKLAQWLATEYQLLTEQEATEAKRSGDAPR